MAAQARKLSELGLTARGGADIAVTGLSVDSRAVRPGHLFAALAGSRAHGAAYIPTALERGAVAILTDAEGAQLAGDLPAGVAPMVALGQTMIAGETVIADLSSEAAARPARRE